MLGLELSWTNLGMASSSDSYNSIHPVDVTGLSSGVIGLAAEVTIPVP